MTAARAVPLQFDQPPQAVCLLRLSSIGDTCHTVALLRALQNAWPQARFTWIIGAAEATLMRAILPEVEFIIFDKRHSLAALRSLRRVLAGRRFDVLLHLQLALRASMASTLVHAPIRVGFDFARARELQWLFSNVRIEPRAREHVLDSLLGFARACGIELGAPRWNIGTCADADASALTAADDRAAADERSTLVISPASSHPARNWHAQGYAAVASHAVEKLGMRVLLAGGRSAVEKALGAQISSALPGRVRGEITNAIGKDTLPALLCVLSHARVLLTPDSGPAHMASMVGTPVIGLYAATNSLRSGPYFSLRNCVDEYDAACRKFLGKSAAQVSWTQKIERPGVMDLIKVPQVIARLEQVVASHGQRNSGTALPR